LSPLITLNYTHAHTYSTTPLDEGSARGRGLYPKHTTLTGDRHPLLPAGFEPAIPASERPQTHALDCASAMDMKHRIMQLFVAV
jgi:hypothetical protein